MDGRPLGQLPLRHHGRDHEIESELAFDKDGHILALRLSGYGNAGAYPVARCPTRSTR